MRRPGNVLLSSSKPLFPEIRLEQCLAKTRLDDEGHLKPGRLLIEHCLIVGSVAQALIANFPGLLRENLFLPGSALLAACHDVGKLSPTFYLRLHIALKLPFTELEEHLLRMLGLSRNANELRDFESRWSGHSGVSAITLLEITGNQKLSMIVGQHHGSRATGVEAAAAGDAFGGEVWQRERRRLVSLLQQTFGSLWPEKISPVQQLLLAGLTSVADWIGSGSLFDCPDTPWSTQIAAALESAGQNPPRFRSGLAFGDIFRDMNGRPWQPNEAQIRFYEAVKAPGVYILEAPMGMGKTEAALYAAYKMLAAGMARGIYFALPTQLTSEKIHVRFGFFLDTILAPDSPHISARLLHGKAHLISEMGEQGLPGGSWFASGKRGLLAPFAVGTLDQALMAAMNVKHGFVRAFGLAGKVVILDEIHSYDAYTGLIAKRLVEILRELHCTVIILSATLTQQRRRALMNAEHDNLQHAYPLITAQPRTDTSLTAIALTPPASRLVRLNFATTPEATEEALCRAEQGQQVLWIENTVNDAQERYACLASRCTDLGLECGLLHSRFTLSDRGKNETRWVSLYGKDGQDERGSTGRILIGTQVLEQSIDIDADFLVTRFAPTDMLMQRLGRLWRHGSTSRPPSASEEAWILAPELEFATEEPYQAFRSGAWVYAPYSLCRSLEVWRGREEVNLPADIRPMLEETYAERKESGAMNCWKQELYDGKKTYPVRKGVRDLEQRARLTLSGAAQTLPESHAQTRYSEQDDRAFLLLRAVETDVRAQLTRVQLLCGDWLTIPWKRHQQNEIAWRRQALRLENECVRLRASTFPEDESCRLWKQGLEHIFYAGHSAENESPDVVVAIVEESGDLRGVDGEFLCTTYRYRYRSDTGLQLRKKE